MKRKTMERKLGVSGVKPEQPAMPDYVAAIRAVTEDKNVKSCTIFCGPRMRVRLSRVNKSPGDYRLTVGRPNFEECTYLSWCKKLGKSPDRFWFKWFIRPEQVK